jgi:hypothetical protein
MSLLQISYITNKYVMKNPLYVNWKMRGRMIVQICGGIVAAHDASLWSAVRQDLLLNPKILASSCLSFTSLPPPGCLWKPTQQF